MLKVVTRHGNTVENNGVEGHGVDGHGVEKLMVFWVSRETRHFIIVRCLL